MRRLSALLLLFSASAVADGGKVLLHQDSGQYTITVFLASADLSVLVQDRSTSEPILDAGVAIQFGETQIPATHQQAQNKLLYSATLPAETSGEVSFAIIVNHGPPVGGTLNMPITRPFLASNWQALTLPPFLILIFMLHEWLVRRKKSADATPTR